MLTAMPLFTVLSYVPIAGGLNMTQFLLARANEQWQRPVVLYTSMAAVGKAQEVAPFSLVLALQAIASPILLASDRGTSSRLFDMLVPLVGAMEALPLMSMAFLVAPSYRGLPLSLQLFPILSFLRETERIAVPLFLSCVVKATCVSKRRNPRVIGLGGLARFVTMETFAPPVATRLRFPAVLKFPMANALLA